jgi:hypothetical protein
MRYAIHDGKEALAWGKSDERNDRPSCQDVRAIPLPHSLSGRVGTRRSRRTMNEPVSTSGPLSHKPATPPSRTHRIVKRTAITLWVLSALVFPGFFLFIPESARWWKLALMIPFMLSWMALYVAFYAAVRDNAKAGSPQAKFAKNFALPALMSPAGHKHAPSGLPAAAGSLERIGCPEGCLAAPSASGPRENATANPGLNLLQPLPRRIISGNAPFRAWTAMCPTELGSGASCRAAACRVSRRQGYLRLALRDSPSQRVG